MKATQILIEEHRIITCVLNCLEKIVAEAESGGKLNITAAEAVLDFFRNFADGCHHAKEEDRLFIMMEEKGVPKQGGPIGVMLYEHESGRHLISGMARAVESAAQGDKEAIGAFASNAREYVALLSAHIQKENQVLFPMADSICDTSCAHQLLTDFKSIEDKAGGKRHLDYIEKVRSLCEQYDVAFLTDDELATIRGEFLQ